MNQKTKISPLVPVIKENRKIISQLHQGWAEIAAQKMGVSVAMVRYYARGERCRRFPHKIIELNRVLNGMLEELLAEIDTINQ